MSNRNFAPIRGRISEKPQIQTESENISVVIGRIVLPPRSINQTEEHPLETFVKMVDGNPLNADRGSIIMPEKLMLRVLSPDMFDQLYDNWAISRRLTNGTQRSKKRNIRAITSDIRQMFSEQMEQDAVLKTVSMQVDRRPRPNMFEPDIDLFDELELGYDPIDSAYFSRGPVRLGLRKRLLESEGNILSVGLRGLEDDDSNRVITDDLHRVNAALRTVGLLSPGMFPIRVEDLELDIPVFVRNPEDRAEDQGPIFPLVPMGLVDFQPLSIHEIH